MRKRKKAIIIADMLRDFMEKGGALYCGDKARRIIPAVRKSINGFRKDRALVIYAQDAHKPDDKEFKLFGRHSVKGSRGSEILPELKPEKGDFVVRKTTYDAAHKTGLIKILKRYKIKDVYLTGVCTSICVMETASSLTKEGFNIYIIKNAVADFDNKAHKHALKRMKLVYGAKII